MICMQIFRTFPPELFLFSGMYQAIANTASKTENPDRAHTTTLTKVWWRGFKKRHPTLSLATPRSLEQGRAKQGNNETIDDFFDKLEKICGDNDISATTMWKKIQPLNNSIGGQMIM